MSSASVAFGQLSANCYPLNHSKGSIGHHSYGTAGFRADASLLDHVMYRVGIIAALLSKECKGQAVGVMVTASHNPVKDNGVKIVEPRGEMLRASWEPRCEEVINCPDDELGPTLERLFQDIDMGIHSIVYIGRDSRPSSDNFAMAVADGSGLVPETSVRSTGLVTTPQLHYCVAAFNNPLYGEATLHGYCTRYAQAFNALIGNRTIQPLVLDCANGVGSHLARRAAPFVPGLKLTLINDGDGVLNEGCGADFVKSNQKPTGNFSDENGRCAVFDGDADRLLYFFTKNGKFRLLDGDRIASLFANYVRRLLEMANLENDLKVGIVQTAYANGAAMRYAESCLGKENVHFAKTGVKHLHHEAAKLDIGVYFEANGHGTICFSEKFHTIIKGSNISSPESSVDSDALSELIVFSRLINDTVGDAWTDLLAVEAILARLDMSMEEWAGLYTDLPNRLCKVKVADRNAITTTDAERICVTPHGLQEKLDALVEKVPMGRSFIRPSGTEDVVRVYAEAETEEQVESLAKEVCELVNQFC